MDSFGMRLERQFQVLRAEVFDHKARTEFQEIGRHSRLDHGHRIGKHVLHPVLLAERRYVQAGRQHTDVVRSARAEHHAVRRELHRLVIPIRRDVCDLEEDRHLRFPGADQVKARNAASPEAAYGLPPSVFETVSIAR
jgi:hypothetical protein